MTFVFRSSNIFLFIRKKVLMVTILTIFLFISVFINCLMFMYIIRLRKILQQDSAKTETHLATVTSCDQEVSCAKSEDEIKLLFLGNSITRHCICNYWWGERGMASSSTEKDYVHIVANKLAEQSNVKMQIVNFASWEVMGYDRSENLMLLDGYLKNSPDYVIVQLGENITDYDSLKDDYSELFQYLKEKSPQSMIMALQSFWHKIEDDKAKQLACQEKEVLFLPMRNFKTGKIAEKTMLSYSHEGGWHEDIAFQCPIGTKVEGDDGIVHVVEHSGVARHPGDLGMQMIAEVILDAIFADK